MLTNKISDHLSTHFFKTLAAGSTPQEGLICGFFTALQARVLLFTSLLLSQNLTNIVYDRPA
jgi:hypothetical protein